MPFFIANPKNSGSSQIDGSRYTEYNRTKPSAMFLLCTMGASLLLPLYTGGFFYLVLAIFMGSENTRAKIKISSARSVQVHLPTDKQLPIKLPSVEIKFRPGKNCGHHFKWLEDRSATTVKIGSGGRNADVFRVDISTFSEDDLAHLLSMRPDIDNKYRSTAEYISFSSILPAMRIREQLSSILIGHGALTSGQAKLYYSGLGNQGPAEDWNALESFDGISGVSMDVQNAGKMYSPDDMWIGVDWSVEGPSPWGKTGEGPTGPGLAVPFVRNYANPDTEGISWFLKTHFRLLGLYGEDVVATAGKIEVAWRTDIYLTQFGLEVAHIFKVLELAFSAGVFVFVLLSDSVYNGCFMSGKDFMITRADGETFEPVTENVQKEWASLSIHDSVLEQIRKLLKMPVDWETPKTMRRLRSMVFVGGEPDGVTKNKIQELLPDLTFKEAPDSINSSTLVSTLEFLTSEEFIPDTMYLDRRSFFQTRRDILILARFGPRAPSFNSGNVLTRMCSDARGPGVSSAKVYSNAAPVPLQVVRKPTLPAANDWVGLLKYGVAHLEGSKVLEGGFEFRGSDRGLVWGALNSRISAVIRREAEKEQSYAEKHGLEEGEVVEPTKGNVEIGNAKKKIRIF